MSEEVATRIRRAVGERGPITFAEFMEHALYGPGGFYERPPVGPSRHFVTSPHVHPVFGSLLAEGVRGLWATLGRPDPFPLVEVGAGDGTLAAQLLENLADLPIEYTAVERSAGSRTTLARLPVRVTEDLDDRIRDGCVLANELLDNLPFRRVRRTADGSVEVRVGVDADRLVEVESLCDDALAALCPDLDAGEEAAVPTGALDFVDGLAGSLSRGYALLIDYGEASGGPAGEVHGYRAHRVVEAVLEDPGSADVTAGVDFSVLVRRAEEHGLTALRPVTQRAALKALGFAGWAEGELRRQGELLRAGSGMEAVRTWGGRSRASL
ncbi:MAG: SAM-dependent methyltransferase, partial [Actinobacteria bacterium]|nr:SAM-dependent methyltransferase [Actinomycetota bacterium]